MLALIRTILIIIGLIVVYQLISKLLSSAARPGTSSSYGRKNFRNRDDNPDDGEYVEYEEIK